MFDMISNPEDRLTVFNTVDDAIMELVQQYVDQRKEPQFAILDMTERTETMAVALATVAVEDKDDWDGVYSLAWMASLMIARLGEIECQMGQVDASN